MTNIYDFMSDSPMLTFFIIVGIGIILESTFNFIKFLINRPLRAMNIKKHGWPPEYCDGDGDFKPESEESEK